LNADELRDFLDAKAEQYNSPDFIGSDPIQVPHRFTLKEDIEISAFLAATIAWGNRKSIITNANRMMSLMGGAPYDFVMSHRSKDLVELDSFVHRTFNGQDFTTFIRALRHIYENHGGMEAAFASDPENLQHGISLFKKSFFEIDHQPRTHRQLADPAKNSAAKRINMFLRWMVRDDNRGVDFGIWKSISPANLSCPLDVHSGGVARKLGLLSRKQDDAKAVAELDAVLRTFDSADPVKYDFALFGLGAFEGF